MENNKSQATSSERNENNRYHSDVSGESFADELGLGFNYTPNSNSDPNSPIIMVLEDMIGLALALTLTLSFRCNYGITSR
jgi:hypothetical protein